jgi:hypothetical protein
VVGGVCLFNLPILNKYIFRHRKQAEAVPVFMEKSGEDQWINHLYRDEAPRSGYVLSV